jgi:hypothetical protein
VTFDGAQRSICFSRSLKSRSFVAPLLRMTCWVTFESVVKFAPVVYQDFDFSSKVRRKIANTARSLS